MKTKFHYLALLMVFSGNVLAEQTVELEVKGVKDKELLENVLVFLAQIDKAEADGSERYRYRVEQEADKALRAKGYYNSLFQFTQSPRKGKKDLLVLNISLDQPTKLDERDIKVEGELGKDVDYQKLIEKAVPASGTVLNHDTYEGLKSSLEKLAQAKGYFDANWLYHRLEVYPREHTADWRLGYNSGIRYKYGEISFTNSQIREDYMRNILRIKPGDYYYINDLSKLSSDYSSSNWFSSVLVEPDVNEQDKTVALHVLLQPKKRNQMEIGVGYATDVGPRFQFNWKKPWINSRGHSLETTTFISTPEQRVELGYNMPVKENPLKYYYQVSAGIERENRDDTRFTGANLGFQRFWNHETGWAFSLGMKARYDSFQQGSEPRTKTLLLYPTASLNRTRSDGNRFPLWGDSQRLTVNWGNKVWASDVNFYSFKASTAWIRTYAHNHRFVLRGEVGYLNADDFTRITPSLRYFAGGDMSVRGFGYKKISPKDSDGKLTGGSHLLTTAVEYQYQLYPNWWGALFYDTGLSSHHFKSAELHSGAGIGVRWASPIGAIKFDLATPVSSPNNEKGVQFYIGLGSEL
ncbi:hypothetical protein BMT54_07125 [Pasteurellaceae bacterium 15-036681]|nr:hypothetical protein BMT54_07125 [Pasteurellaceae bacterium 15-036681]